MTVAIPGTNYSIQNQQILNGQGDVVSPEEFKSQVESGKIALSGPALTVLGSEDLGGNYSKVVAGLNTNSTTPTDVAKKLDETGGSEVGGDMMMAVMVAMHKAQQAQRKAARALEDAALKSTMQQMDNQIDKMKSAALTRLVTGITVAVVQGVSAGIQMRGAIKAQGAINSGTKLADGSNSNAAMAQAIGNKASAAAQMGQAVGSLGQSIGDYTASTFDAEAKGAEKDTMQMQAQHDRAKKLTDNAQETEAKIREAIQAIQQAEDQAALAAARM